MKDQIKIILYPVMCERIGEERKRNIKDILFKEFKSVNEEDIDNAFEKEISDKELKNLLKNIEKSKEIKLFNTSRKILELFDFSKRNILRIAEIGKILKINRKNTGFNLDIYNIDEINDFEYKKTIRRFSLVCAAIGFLPIPIADIVILTPLQIGMITKISHIYEFKLEPREFFKMIGGVVGAGILFKISASIVNSFIPIIGWGVKAAIAYAGTYALGILTKRYIEVNGELTSESIKTIWEKSFTEGKSEFANLKDYIYKKKDELLVEVEKFKDEFKTNIDKKKTENRKQKTE